MDDNNSGNFLPPNQRPNFRTEPEMYIQTLYVLILTYENRHNPDLSWRLMDFLLLRIFTFLNFPRNRPDIRDFAEAGFYYSGNEDIVVCFSCGFNRGNWAEADIPIDIHRRYAPECLFLRSLNLENISMFVFRQTCTRDGQHGVGINRHNVPGPSPLVHDQYLRRTFRGHDQVFNVIDEGTDSLPMANLPATREQRFIQVIQAYSTESDLSLVRSESWSYIFRYQMAVQMRSYDSNLSSRSEAGNIINVNILDEHPFNGQSLRNVESSYIGHTSERVSAHHVGIMDFSDNRYQREEEVEHNFYIGRTGQPLNSQITFSLENGARQTFTNETELKTIYQSEINDTFENTCGRNQVREESSSHITTQEIINRSIEEPCSNLVNSDCISGEQTVFEVSQIHMAGNNVMTDDYSSLCVEVSNELSSFSGDYSDYNSSNMDSFDSIPNQDRNIMHSETNNKYQDDFLEEMPENTNKKCDSAKYRADEKRKVQENVSSNGKLSPTDDCISDRGEKMSDYSGTCNEAEELTMLKTTIGKNDTEKLVNNNTCNEHKNQKTIKQNSMTNSPADDHQNIRSQTKTQSDCNSSAEYRLTGCMANNSAERSDSKRLTEMTENTNIFQHSEKENYPYDEKNVETDSRTHIPYDDGACVQTQINGNALDLISKEDNEIAESKTYLSDELSMLEPVERDVTKIAESELSANRIHGKLEKDVITNEAQCERNNLDRDMAVTDSHDSNRYMTSIIQSVPHQSEGNPDAKIPMPDAEMSTKWNDSVDEPADKDIARSTESSVNGTSSELKGNICEGDETGNTISLESVQNQCQDSECNTITDKGYLETCKEDEGEETRAHSEVSYDGDGKHSSNINSTNIGQISTTEVLGTEKGPVVGEGDDIEETHIAGTKNLSREPQSLRSEKEVAYVEDKTGTYQGEETQAHREVSYDGDRKHSSSINTTKSGQISTTELLGTTKIELIVGEGDDIEETNTESTTKLSFEPQSLRGEKEVVYVDETDEGEETQAHREVSYDDDRKHSSSINSIRIRQISTTELLGTTQIEAVVGEGDDIEETHTESTTKLSLEPQSLRSEKEVAYVKDETDVGEETQAHGEVSYAVDKKHSSSINTTNMIRTTELLGTTKIESAVGEGNDIEETHTESTTKLSFEPQSLRGEKEVAYVKDETDEGEETQAHSEVSYAVDRKHSSSINSTKIGQIYTTERLGTTKIESVVGEVDDIEEIHIAGTKKLSLEPQPLRSEKEDETAVCQAAELKVKLRSSNEDLECPFVQEANTTVTDERGVSDGNCIPQASDGNSSECRSRVVSPRPLESDINKSNESRDEIPRTVHREIDRKDRRTGAVSVGVEETKNLEKSHLVIDNSTTMTGYENKIDHPEENCIYQCKLCKEAPFPEKSRVIQHLKSSHFGYCYVCLCGREFATKGAPHTCRKDKKQFEAFNTKSKLKGKQAEDEAYKYEKEMAEKYIEVIHRKTRKVKKSNENLNATRKDTEHRKLNEIRGKKKTQKQLKPAQTKTVNECNGLKRKSKCLKKNDSQEEDTFIGKKNKRIREHALLERANEINPETKPSPDPKEDTMSDTRDVEMSPVSVRISDEQLVPEEEQSKNLNVADNVKLVQKHQEGYIQLNVGGTVFQTSKVTLLNNGYSVLSEMMQQNSPVRIQNKCIFIDRDPEHFRFILNFLRNKCEIPQEIYPTERVVLQELLLEAKFYNIEKLITELNKILED